ncbi:MAG TPA: P1 family peptidase [Actinomycetota bacterium]|nr:P1 family peptidase [Actinomycetota bacterium]
MITRVEGITVGHWTDPVGRTGCTVILAPPGTVGSGEVRGGAPGTRETDLLRPGMLVEEVHAVVLCGGSAFGLAAADGVVRWLEARRVGFDAGVARVPIVPAAVVFDLDVGDPAARPGPMEGAAACEAASPEPAVGPVGAGTGATVGADRVPGGLGSAAVDGGGAVVGALAVVNPFGAVVDDEGRPVAGRIPDPGAPPRWPGANTVLGVVATDARITKERAHAMAVAAHDGLARAVEPAHTMWDGDTVFTLATGGADASGADLEGMAAEALAGAIRRAVSHEP